MFYVLNKEKIITYIVSITAVIMLFCFAGVLNSKKYSEKNEKIVQTDSQITDNNEKIENNSKF